MNKNLTLLLAGLTMVGPLAIDTYLPSFPAIGTAFLVSPAVVQQTLSVYLFTFAIMMLFHGVLSDSFGRRRVILIALLIYTVASWAAVFAQTFTELLMARAMQGFAAGAGAVVSQAIVRDTVSGPQAQQVLSRIMVVFALAPALAPVIGGWLQVLLGWQAVFVFLGSFGLLMLVWSYFNLAESLPVTQRHPFHIGNITQNYWRVLAYPRYLMLTLSIGLSFGGLALYFGSAAHFIMGILKLPETAFAWLFIPLIAGLMIGSTLAAKLAERFSAEKTIASGYAVMAIAVLLNIGYTAVFDAAVPWAVLPLALYTLGMAMANPSLTLASMDLLPSYNGLSSSLQSFVQMLVFAVVCGFIAPLLYETAFGLACGLGVGVLLSWLSWRIARWCPSIDPFATPSQQQA